ncbi:hypothetical protein F4679DRAFT_205002 [Xylaria curta]|nr:hypothetical protein F4679DRAFT_205002 [Xylaria curta]
MALLGWSLILASVVYLAIRRPPLIETLIALCRGSPTIKQPPSTRSPSDIDGSPDRGSSSGVSVAVQDTSVRRGAEADRIPLPKIASPEIEIETNEPTSTETPALTIASPSSPQTTPKATPTTLANGSVPSFSLAPSAAPSLSPPASAAAVARGASTQPNLSPSLSPNMSMPPPPRPPKLNPLPNSSSLAPPPRPSPRQYDRQPGTSTLAPPPTHSSKPAKPSRKVTLEPGHSPLDWARLSNDPKVDLRGLGPEASYIRVTPSMLKRQTGRRGKDAWTALGGRVYNISPYLPYHPGGEPELLRAAGRDGTKLFGEIHPWVNFETMLSSCLVGLLVEEGEERSAGEMETMD